MQPAYPPAASPNTQHYNSGYNAPQYASAAPPQHPPPYLWQQFNSAAAPPMAPHYAPGAWHSAPQGSPPHAIPPALPPQHQAQFAAHAYMQPGYYAQVPAYEDRSAGQSESGAVPPRMPQPALGTPNTAHSTSMTDARAAGLGRIAPDAPLPAPEAPLPMYPALNTAPLSPDLATIMAGVDPAATKSENDNTTLPNAPPAEPTQRDADDEFGDIPPGMKNVLRSFLAAQLDGARSTEMLARVLSGMQQSPSPNADANSFANADGTRLPRLFDTTFTGAEIEKCLLTLDVETWAEELHAFEDYIRNKDTNLPAVFGMDDMQWAHATHPSNPAYKTLMAADAYAGRQISVCLDHKLPRVKRFLKEQRNPARSGAPTSARTMLAAIVVFQKPRTQGDLDKVKTRYETGVFFTVGMDVDEAQLAALRCVEAFESNPHRSVHPFAVQLALLDKLVASPDAATSHVIAAFADPPQALATIISNYRATILRCELDPEEDARSLAIVKMQSVLAYAVAVTPAIVQPRRHRPPWGRKTAVPLSAFDASTATEQWCQDDDCTGCGECGSCESQPDLQADVASGACWDCGEQVPDAHPMRQCNKNARSVASRSVRATAASNASSLQRRRSPSGP